MSTSLYPVRVDARLEEEHLSRWLWLVKWLLAIPHYLVLALLWLAFVVLSAVALVAILFTGRYPRASSTSTSGCCGGPGGSPTTPTGARHGPVPAVHACDERPDYPAHLDVAYPEHLSRGLVLVKWWLLAIPHYLVSRSSPAAAPGRRDAGTTTRPGSWSGGLIGLLVLVAAVVLLFTGRYPRTIFDLVLGHEPVGAARARPTPR